FWRLASLFIFLLVQRYVFLRCITMYFYFAIYNRYDVDSSLRGKRIQIRYNPFDLTTIQVWKDNERFEDAKPAEFRNQSHSKLPSETDSVQTPAGVSSFLEQLKKQQEEEKRKKVGTTSFAQLKEKQPRGNE
ncbi:Mu transposase-like protein, partial [Scopulibacillus darangshiensis]